MGLATGIRYVRKKPSTRTRARISISQSDRTASCTILYCCLEQLKHTSHREGLVPHRRQWFVTRETYGLAVGLCAGASSRSIQSCGLALIVKNTHGSHQQLLATQGQNLLVSTG